MHKIRPFEIGLIVFFAIAAIAGLFLFSTWKNTGTENPYGNSVEIWGTFESQHIGEILRVLGIEDENLKVIRYTEVRESAFDEELIDAIAEGRSPDLVLMPHSKLVKFRTKLQPISFETYSERDYRNTYIDGAEIFMRDDGIYGIPFAVDPLVMYWNRDLFSTSGLSQPPKTWDVLINQTVKAVTQVNDNRGIEQSAVAFGEYRNVLHAKEILSMLLLQSGSQIISEADNRYKVVLNQAVQNSNLKPGEMVLNFYTQFALSTKELHSWSRAMSLDQFEFIRGNLGLYFAPASEYSTIEEQNVNLNFDVAPVPQDSSASIPRTYGDFYAFSIPKGSDNILGAYRAAQYLANVAGDSIPTSYGMVPVHRSLHGGVKGGSLEGVSYPAALIARGWLDPEPVKSKDVFGSMIEDVTSGKIRVSESVYNAIRKLETLFR